MNTEPELTSTWQKADEKTARALQDMIKVVKRGDGQLINVSGWVGLAVSGPDGKDRLFYRAAWGLDIDPIILAYLTKRLGSTDLGPDDDEAILAWLNREAGDWIPPDGI